MPVGVDGLANVKDGLTNVRVGELANVRVGELANVRVDGLLNVDSDSYKY